MRTEQQPLESQGPRRYQHVLVNRPMRRLHTGEFSAAHRRHSSKDAWIFFDPDLTRMSNYFLCTLAQQALDDTDGGDFLLAGVSYGTSAKVIAEALDVASTGRAWWLIDPFDGSGNPRYNHSLATAQDGWDDRIPTRWVSGRIPAALEALDGSLAFAHLATGKYAAERPALDIILPRLVPGGCIMLDIYGTLIEQRQQAIDELLADHGLRSWELPTGQLAARRRRAA